jgi:hypothetical protein
MLQYPHTVSNLHRSCISTNYNLYLCLNSTCILGKSISSALTDSIPIVDCRNAERPFVKLKTERRREYRKGGHSWTLCTVTSVAARVISKGLWRNPNKTPCFETHMPVVKYIPHEYRLSEELQTSLNVYVKNVLFSSVGFLWVMLWRQQLKRILQKCRMINELWIGKGFQRNNRFLIDVPSWYSSVCNKIDCKKKRINQDFTCRDPD